jgi:mono/diheme cytochrome c family protein
MRAHQIMTRQVITVGADATMVEAVDTMLRHRISRLPVAGKLIGIISEGDFIRRAEVGTQRERRRRLTLNQYRRLFYLSVALTVALTLLGSAAAAFAQNLENGRRLSERWCSQCHAIGPAPAKFDRAQSFASIAAKDKITTEMIASFLRLPHATMPNVPLSRKDAQDIAAFIMDMKK